MRIRKVPVVVLFVIAGLVVAGWYGLRQMKASFSYGICAEFEHLPENDTEFETWIKAQPGVVRADVVRTGNSVGVIFIMVQTVGSRQPPVPDVSAAFDRLGYKGLIRTDYDWRG